MGRGLTYYDVLGIPRNADDATIKRAFRRLALKHHPDADDTPEGQQEFQAVCEAYDVLSDPRAKGTYDLFGEEVLKQGAEGRAPYAFDPVSGSRAVFMRFFGTVNPYEALEALSAQFEVLTAPKHLEPAPPTVVNIEVPLEELWSGCRRSVRHRRTRTTQGGELLVQERCLEVTVLPGTLDGTLLVFDGEGNSAANQAPGPVHVVVSAAPHARFSRQGSDLVAAVKLPLHQALTGGVVSLQMLDGRTLQLPLGSIVRPGDEQHVAGEGMPVPNSDARGDLLLRMEVVFPAHLTQPQKLLLRAALFLPPKLDEAQAHAVRALEAAFVDVAHGWSSGFVKEAIEGS